MQPTVTTPTTSRGHSLHYGALTAPRKLVAYFTCLPLRIAVHLDVQRLEHELGFRMSLHVLQAAGESGARFSATERASDDYQLTHGSRAASTPASTAPSSSPLTGRPSPALAHPQMEVAPSE